jgi:RNA polymerase sigma-70 factor (ECF subfamily)
VRTAKPAELAVKPRELARDNGTMAGKRSLAGGGHAIRFEAPGEGWYLTAVKVHGSRYGAVEAPEEQFTIYLCDEKFNRIAAFSFPYVSFRRGEAEWVTLDVNPTQVPAKFMICAEFNPTARKGVFVSHDGGGGGSSFTGLPGEKGQPFPKGDWMIRAVLDRRGAE